MEPVPALPQLAEQLKCHLTEIKTKLATQGHILTLDTGGSHFPLHVDAFIEVLVWLIATVGSWERQTFVQVRTLKQA